MTSPPRIAIVGAGIGGLTLAAALRATGTPYDVFERAHALAEVGAGVQMSPNAIRPLRHLGVRVPEAVPLAAMEIHGWAGNPIAGTELGAACEQLYGAPYWAVHRAHLQRALLRRVEPGRIHLGRPLDRVTPDGDGVLLRFRDGTTHPADVVVGADGIRSAVRAVLARDRPLFSGLGAFRGTVPMHRIPAAARGPVARMWLGPGRHFVCYPVAGGRLMSFAAIAPLHAEPTESWSATATPADLVTAFEGWPELVARVTRAADDVRYWALYDREPLPRWSTDRSTLLGDAAHPMLPFLAQGANQAVEDALDLAALLAGAAVAELPGRLARYEALRAPRTAAIQQSARGHATALHLPDGPAQRERDITLRGSAKLRDRAWLYGYQPGRAAHHRGEALV